MKVVFTVIALSLCVIAIRNTELIKKAEAYMLSDRVGVHILNTDDIGSSIAKKLSSEFNIIEPLYVRVTD